MISSRYTFYILTSANIVFIKKRCDFLIMWYPYQVFIWKMSKSKPYIIGLNQSQYKIFKYFFDLPIYINSLSKVLVRL